MKELFLGIDTSNYKTSISVVDENCNIIFNRSEYLDVKLGEKGLRQSEAFFKHSNRLPEFVADVFSSVNPSDISAIGVSTRPRRVDGSYMPCFLAGHNLAKELSSALSIPVYEYSHQEGHAAAVMSEYPDLFHEKTLLFHLSGGTTEYLVCTPDAEGFSLEIVGGTKDISYGQLLDRIGVILGKQFPSGKYLDEIALKYDESSIDRDKLIEIKQLVTKPVISDCSFNLSGLETKLTRYINTNTNKEDVDLIIGRLFIIISNMLLDSADELSNRYGISKVLMAGGVASSASIRKLISKDAHSESIIFCNPELSGDNAVGVAILAKNASYNK